MEIKGKPINIRGKIKRHEIVRRVLNAFIDNEYKKKGKGVYFIYPVENVGEDHELCIARPGHKKNFDFKVQVEEWHKISEGSHDDIAEAVRSLKYSSVRRFNKFWEVLEIIYLCEESNVEKAIEKGPRKTKLPRRLVDILKIIKWMFIMEDILYWDNEGRAFLFNALLYYSSLDEGEEAESFKNPDKLRSKMKKKGISWVKAYGR